MAVPAAETMLARGVPGAEDVTDGDVDYYGTDWINVETLPPKSRCRNASQSPAAAQLAAPETHRSRPTGRTTK